MSNDTLTKDDSSLFLVDEVVPGVFVAPTSASQAVEPLKDGTEFNYSRDPIPRNTLTGTKEKVASRLGGVKVEGSISMELKAGASEGAAPRGDSLYKSVFGGFRQITVETVTGINHTASRIYIPDSAIGRFKKHDVIHLKIPGAHAIRPILAVSEVPGAAYIDLFIPLDDAPVDGFTIAKMTMYHYDNNEFSSSGSYYSGGQVLEKIPGIKAIAASIKGWKAKETPSVEFKIEANDKIKSIEVPAFVPDFSQDAEVPVVMGSLAWLGQENLSYIELAANFENTIATLPDASRRSGKKGTRKTSFGATGSIDPYMEVDNIDRWNSFKNNQRTSLFSYSPNYSDVEGEFSQVVFIWLPFIRITNMPTADQDGVLLDKIEFEAERVLGKDSAFLGFI